MTNGDWIQVWIAGALTLTLGLVALYVLATKRIAKATFQPVLDQWIDVNEQLLMYWNIGMGPALNIRWQLGEQSDQRLGMGIRDEKGKLATLDLTKVQSPATLIAEYNDVDGTPWHSTLLLVRGPDGKWGNGTPTYGMSRKRSRFKRAFDQLLQ